MNAKRAITYRIGAGKALGLLVGLIGFWLLPKFMADATYLLRTGLLLWYALLGLMIGIFGIYSRHPILRFSMPWWIRGSVLGAFMNFTLVLIAYEQLCLVSMSIFGEYSVFVSPFWFVLEGALLGMLFDYLLTHWFGDGWADEL